MYLWKPLITDHERNKPETTGLIGIDRRWWVDNIGA